MKPIFDKYEEQLGLQGLRIERKDIDRPWGGFFVIDESQARDFINLYFAGRDPEELLSGRKLSPKILVVAPHKRLSWQYHHRREEIWRVVEGPVAVAKSPNDRQPSPDRYNTGQEIVFGMGDRHRLIGMDDWGVVAEIWQHTDPDHPSDEDDIVRLEDDFGRG